MKTYQLKNNLSSNNNYQPISSTRRAQNQSTPFNTYVRHNSLDNRRNSVKTDISQKDEVSPDRKNYQKSEGRKTLKSCFKKKRKKTVDPKSVNIKIILDGNTNKYTIENEPKKNVRIVTTNKEINKEATSPKKTTVDSKENNSTTYNNNKTDNKKQNNYSINQNINNTERKQNNNENKNKNNYENKNIQENKNKYDNKISNNITCPFN